MTETISVGDELVVDGYKAEVTRLDATWTDYSGDTNPGTGFRYTEGPEAGKEYVLKTGLWEARRAAQPGWEQEVARDLQTVLDAAGQGAHGEVTAWDSDAARVTFSAAALSRLAAQLSDY